MSSSGTLITNSYHTSAHTYLTVLLGSLENVIPAMLLLDAVDVLPLHFPWPAIPSSPPHLLSAFLLDFKDHFDCIGSTWIIQDNLLSSIF
jgi:hypothetical protein